MRVFLQILKENTKNHSSGKMGNYIELLRCGYYLVTQIHTEKGVKQKMFKTGVLFTNQ
jgi:hypothetical protein